MIKLSGKHPEMHPFFTAMVALRAHLLHIDGRMV